jgi:hypothetical protein
MTSQSDDSLVDLGVVVFELPPEPLVEDSIVVPVVEELTDVVVESPPPPPPPPHPAASTKANATSTTRRSTARVSIGPPRHESDAPSMITRIADSDQRFRHNGPVSRDTVVDEVGSTATVEEALNIRHPARRRTALSIVLVLAFLASRKSSSAG